MSMNTAVRNKIKMAILREIPMKSIMETETVEMVVDHCIDTFEPVLKFKDMLTAIGWGIAFMSIMFHFV